jgi:hypothetical protein
MKQADAQPRRIPLFLIFANARLLVSLNADVAPTRENAEAEAVASPMEEMKARTCWNSLYGGTYAACQVNCIVFLFICMKKCSHDEL